MSNARLVANAPVPDAECWFRTITNSGHLNKDGSLNLQGLKGAFSASAAPGFAQEMSGQLVSQLTLDEIVAAAEQKISAIREKLTRDGKTVPSKIQFTGIVCATAAVLRRPYAHQQPTDVLYTPLPNDKAHADFVTAGDVEETKAEITRRLVTIYRSNLTADRLNRCGAPT